MESNEMDSKISPLAMLTRACNKIESDMMSSNGSAANSQSAVNKQAVSRNNNLSPKLSLDRPRSSSDNHHKLSPAPASARKCSPPLKSSGSSSYKSSASPTDHHSRAMSKPQSAISPKHSAASIVPPTSSSAMSYSVAAMAAAAMATGSSSTTGSTAGSHLPPVLPPNSMSAYASMAAPPGLAHPRGPPSPCTDPLCRDPTCPTNMLKQAQQYAAMMAMARGNPYASMYPGMMAGLPGMPGAGAADPTPFVCNWVNGGDFCGKKFPSSEDLMSHLRSHTSSAASPTSASAAAVKASPAVAAKAAS